MKVLTLLTALLFTLLFAFVSCSSLNDEVSGAISFSLSERMLASGESSDENAPSNSHNYHLKIALTGDYEAEKEAQIEGDTTITFDEIPVGVSVTVSAEVYGDENDEDGNEILYYSGKSEEILIHAGVNNV